VHFVDSLDLKEMARGK